MVNYWLSLLAMGTIVVSGGFAADVPKFPKGLPPLVGLATVSSGPSRPGEAWQIALIVPKVRWQEVGQDPEDKLDKRRREIRTEVEKVTRTLTIGGPSAVASSRVMDLSGKELGSEEVSKRLKSETPVFVSVSGEMVEPYYLQLAKPETLIIILGPRERAPLPALLPAAKGSAEAQPSEKK
jgi:hypothetical protein